MNSPWPIAKLGAVLRRSEETVTILPDAEYREVTVRLWGKGVVLRGLVTGLGIAASRRFVTKTGQLILSRIDARNGAIGIVPSELDGAVVTNDFPLFDVNPENVDSAFLEWLTKTRDFVELCQRASEGTTNRVRLQEDRFLALEIPLPPLAEQRRIVARIEELAVKAGDARNLRQQAVEETMALSRAGVEEYYQRLRNRFGATSLAEVCDSITDGDHNTPAFTEQGVRFIFVGNVSSGRLHFDGCKHVAESYFRTLKAQRLPEQGDILYSAVGATLGVPALVDCDQPFCFQRHLAILKPNRAALNGQFLWHMLRSRTVFEKAWSSTTGSAQPTVPLRAIRKLTIPVPPITEQRRIAAELDVLQTAAHDLKRLQAESAAELYALLPSILDRAFAGEL